MAKKEGSTKKKWWWTSLLLPVVAGLIVEVFSDVEVLSTLWGLVKTIGTTPIPLWLAILLVVGAVGAVFGWVWFMRWLHEVDVPEHYSFTKLRFLDVDWEWEWRGGGIVNPIMLCPMCSNQLYLKADTNREYNQWTKCENCDFGTGFGMTAEELAIRVPNEVQRLVRTGEYKKRLGSN